MSDGRFAVSLIHSISISQLHNGFNGGRALDGPASPGIRQILGAFVSKTVSSDLFHTNPTSILYDHQRYDERSVGSIGVKLTIVQVSRRNTRKTMNGSNFRRTRRQVKHQPNTLQLDPALTTSAPAGTIGISQYAAKALGDVVYVELPSTDLEVEAGGAIGAVESVKSASDIMSPVSGKIIESNETLGDKPGTINQSPEADGWLAKIEVKDPSELDSLMGAEAYKKFTEEADEDH